MGVEAPFDIEFSKLITSKDEVLEGGEAYSLLDQIRWLLQTQYNESQAVEEWDRILRSVVILARAYPEIPLERILDTAVIWERG